MLVEILLILLIVMNVVLLVVLLLKGRGAGLDSAFKHLREEIGDSTTRFSDFILKRINEISSLQNDQFERIRKTVEEKLRLIQEDNNAIYIFQ